MAYVQLTSLSSDSSGTSGASATPPNFTYSRFAMVSYVLGDARVSDVVWLDGVNDEACTAARIEWVTRTYPDVRDFNIWYRYKTALDTDVVVVDPMSPPLAGTVPTEVLQ